MPAREGSGAGAPRTGQTGGGASAPRAGQTASGGMPLATALSALVEEFRAAGLPSPEVDARLLLAAAADVPREALISTPERPLDAVVLQKLDGFRARRLAREPVSRILGMRAFYGRDFEVTLATLDPRPETETLVDAALEVTEGAARGGQPLRVLDVGTGSGCLLATLLAELPAASGLGTDISDEALAVARRNADRLGLGHRARFSRLRSLDGIAETFDVLLSNPPYIPSDEIARLDRDVRAYDPLSALDGGPDGFAVYRELAPRLLAVVPQGWALFEVGAGQAEGVSQLLAAALPPRRLGEIRMWTDLGGHRRCVAVRTQL